MTRTIGYCKDCKNCLTVNANSRYGICTAYNDTIANIDYHSCTDFVPMHKEKEEEATDESNS
jgi:hypothetical protein